MTMKNLKRGSKNKALFSKFKALLQNEA